MLRGMSRVPYAFEAWKLKRTRKAISDTSVGAGRMSDPTEVEAYVISLKVVELKDELKKRHLSYVGNKQVLAQRLREDMLSSLQKATAQAADDEEEEEEEEDREEEQQQAEPEKEIDEQPEVDLVILKLHPSFTNHSHKLASLMESWHDYILFLTNCWDP